MLPAELEFILNTALVSGLIVLCLGVIAVMRRLNARHLAELVVQLEQQSLERGWQYRCRRGGGKTIHNFVGKTDGIPWQIESYDYYRRVPTAANVSKSYTRWWTEAVVLSEEVVLLVPGAGNAFQSPGSSGSLTTREGISGGLTGMTSSLRQMLWQHFVTNMLHAVPEDARAFDNVERVLAGSEALRQRYMVLATNEMTANRFLDDDAERMLLEVAPEKWRGPQKLQVMAVVYWHKGIQLVTPDQITEIGKLEQLIRLGLVLVRGQRSSVWS